MFTLLVVVALLAAVGLAGRVYATYQWRTALVALEADRPAEARARLAVCQRLWPRSPEVHLRAARAARLANDLPAAEALLDRARRLQGGANEVVQIEILLLRVQGGEVDEVAPILIDAVEAGTPDAAHVLQTLSRAYMQRMRYRMAYGCLSRWIDLRPDAVKAYLWRGWTLERLDNSKGAMADYLRVLEMNPDEPTARLRVAEMLMEDKLTPEALPHLERLYRQRPDDPWVQARLGACRLLQGQLEEARPLLEAADDKLRQTNDPSLAVALANLDLHEGRGAEAERRLRAFLAAEPSDTEALFVLSAALRLQGRADDAAAVLVEHDKKTKMVQRTNELLANIVDSATAGPDDFAEIGRLLLEIGRDKTAVYWLERALERNAGHQAAHRSLMQYHERKGDAAQALAHRRRLREPDPPAAPALPSR